MVNGILHEIGCPRLLQSNGPINKNVLVNYVKYFNRSRYIDTCKTRISNLSKCDTYASFKVNFEQEKYFANIERRIIN